MNSANALLKIYPTESEQKKTFSFHNTFLIDVTINISTYALVMCFQLLAAGGSLCHCWHMKLLPDIQGNIIMTLIMSSVRLG